MILSKPRKNSAIILTSRIRLARNVKGERFANSASDIQLAEVWDKCAEALSKVAKFKRGGIIKLSEIPESGRELILENRLATRELLASTEHRGVFISKDCSASVMVNEEDHLRIQVMGEGECLASLWKTINTIDDGIEKNLEYAFSENIGYLTACPTNVGTGMRASLMMHLPILTTTGQIEKVIRGLNQLGMVMRGADGEGSDTFGAFYQLSNQQTLGISETDIVKKIAKFGAKVSEFEINARLKTLQQTPIVLVDKFERALALLRSCKLVDTAEAVGLLSDIRLAADMGFVRGAASWLKKIDEALTEIRPSHLALRFNLLEDDITARDAARAKYLNALAENFPRPIVK